MTTETAVNAPQIVEAIAGRNDPSEATNAASVAGTTENHVIPRDAVPDNRIAAKRIDSQLRRDAERLGLVLRKSRRKLLTGTDRGLYRIETKAGEVKAGECYDLGLDDAELFLAHEMAQRGVMLPDRHTPPGLADIRKSLLHADQLTADEKVQVLRLLLAAKEAETDHVQALKDSISETDQLSTETKEAVFRLICETEGAEPETTSEEHKRILAERDAADAAAEAARELPKYSEIQVGLILAGAARILIERASSMIGNTSELLALFGEMDQLSFTAPDEFLRHESKRRAGC